jgi:hypothetical protein
MMDVVVVIIDWYSWYGSNLLLLLYYSCTTPVLLLYYYYYTTTTSSGGSTIPLYPAGSKPIHNNFFSIAIVAIGDRNYNSNAVQSPLQQNQ